ncbi:MAG: ribosomal RNA small subunit methyltransferase A [Candidatus Magasanikbacteria bacterium]|nr:ribosomal RNA small subunit methyltransferase A [Candidatus Magasanikbacteria bacterium]
MPNLFSQDYLLRLCKKYGLAPSKRYGQNYLIDAGVIETIVAASGVKSSDTIVEVGPGFGVLTLALAEHAKKVVSFEIEKKLQPYWAEVVKKQTNIEIVWGNVLRSFAPPATPYKVVANLPYQITSPVIRLFLETEKPPALMMLMVQKEVAERICAEPGQMSLLSVAVQYYADADIVATVPRSAFWPQPRVDSAVVRITNHESRIMNPDESAKFFALVKAGFANRRKLLMKNLLPVVGKKNRVALTNIFTRLELGPNARAQELSVERWVELTKVVAFLSE